MPHYLPKIIIVGEAWVDDESYADEEQDALAGRQSMVQTTLARTDLTRIRASSALAPRAQSTTTFNEGLLLVSTTSCSYVPMLTVLAAAFVAGLTAYLKGLVLAPDRAHQQLLDPAYEHNVDGLEMPWDGARVKEV